jgi:hypothetical protein|tara:strand:+ start:477 stop:581 length:105 start_codon:yes stop_codon:yes gene_type:complete
MDRGKITNEEQEQRQEEIKVASTKRERREQELSF